MDIKLFKKNNTQGLEQLKESQRRRGRPVEDIDEITRLDEEYAAGKS